MDSRTKIINSMFDELEADSTRLEGFVADQPHMVVPILQGLKMVKDPSRLLMLCNTHPDAKFVRVRFMNLLVRAKVEIAKVRQFITKAQSGDIAAKIILTGAEVEIEREKFGAVLRYVLVGTQENIDKVLAA